MAPRLWHLWSSSCHLGTSWATLGALGERYGRFWLTIWSLGACFLRTILKKVAFFLLKRPKGSVAWRSHKINHQFTKKLKNAQKCSSLGTLARNFFSSSASSTTTSTRLTSTSSSTFPPPWGGVAGGGPKRQKKLFCCDKKNSFFVV